MELLSQDVVTALAREHLGGLADVHVAPDIPRRKLSAARRAHALHLPADEPVVVLFDATLLGGGDDGFVATPVRLAWKNFMETPRAMRWDEVAAAPSEAAEHHVELGRGRVPAPYDEGGPERVRAFLIACAQRMLGPRAPYREVVRAQEPRTLAEAIVFHARQVLGELDWVHYRPSIPPKMEAAARLAHARQLAPDEEILVLYDDTVFGSGNDGFILTERGVRWRNFWQSAEGAAWEDVDPERLAADGDLLRLTGERDEQAERAIDLRMRPGMGSAVRTALERIARAAHAHGAARRAR